MDAFLTAVDASGRVSLDVVYFYSGDRAIKEAASRKDYWDVLECPSGPYRGGSTKGCSISNDYFIVNDNPRIRVLPLSPDAEVALIDWNRCCETRPSTRAELVRRAGEGQVLVQVTVDAAGRVTRVWERYVP